jgi:hypothetical protein
VNVNFVSDCVAPGYHPAEQQSHRRQRQCPRHHWLAPHAPAAYSTTSSDGRGCSSLGIDVDKKDEYDVACGLRFNN